MADFVAYYKDVKLGDVIRGAPDMDLLSDNGVSFEPATYAKYKAVVQRGALAHFRFALTAIWIKDYTASETTSAFHKRKADFLSTMAEEIGFDTTGGTFDIKGPLSIAFDDTKTSTLDGAITQGSSVSVQLNDDIDLATGDLVYVYGVAAWEHLVVEEVSSPTVFIAESVSTGYNSGTPVIRADLGLPNAYVTSGVPIAGKQPGTNFKAESEMTFEGVTNPLT